MVTRHGSTLRKQRSSTKWRSSANFGRAIPNQFGFGEQIGEQCAEFEAEILVEQQLHAAIRTPCSRSAAYDKQARMSSSVSSGQSLRISSCDIPAASQPSTSAT